MDVVVTRDEIAPVATARQVTSAELVPTNVALAPVIATQLVVTRSAFDEVRRTVRHILSTLDARFGVVYADGVFTNRARRDVSNTDCFFTD
ncbi:hypothetical protein AUR65_011595 [Haloferax marisrubri]|uniref:Uncharacterized protein n=1 Tax=Haloferax marisrubri TaxID=1544719 RepID=A0A2P4NPJ4_9EURY|nr:hypothetical protein AUR65_011595 [Haloferax marisrubri]